VKHRDTIIYDLIFSDCTDYEINVAEYISDIYRYDYFILDIKQILKKSKISILSEKVDIDPKKVIWRLKVKK